MKKSTFTILFILLSIGVFAQPEAFTYKRRNAPAVKIEKLNFARSLNTIMSEYDICRYIAISYLDRQLMDRLLSQQNIFFGMIPNTKQLTRSTSSLKTNSIIDYVSIEVIGNCNGKALFATGYSNVLSIDQKNILNNADLGSDVTLSIRFKYKGLAQPRIDAESPIILGLLTFTVVPEIEAEYPGGFEQLSAYYQENLFDKITSTDGLDKLQQSGVKFIVNEKGEIKNIKVARATTDVKIDKLIIDVTSKMPQWKPAQNSTGMKVRQEFNIPFGMAGC